MKTHGIPEVYQSKLELFRVIAGCDSWVYMQKMHLPSTEANKLFGPESTKCPLTVLTAVYFGFTLAVWLLFMSSATSCCLTNKWNEGGTTSTLTMMTLKHVLPKITDLIMSMVYLFRNQLAVSQFGPFWARQTLANMDGWKNPQQTLKTSIGKELESMQITIQ